MNDSELEKLSAVSYEQIAKNFSRTRQKPWPSCRQFVSTLKPGEKLLDVGCGNGRHLKMRDDIQAQGCDLCSRFVQMCQEDDLDVVEADCHSLPYEDDSFDAVICVAVIHHLSTVESRQKAVDELIRVCKPGGRIFVQVWAPRDKPSSKFVPIVERPGDYIVKWRHRDDDDVWHTYDRYCHHFTKESLLSLFAAECLGRISMFEEHYNLATVHQKKVPIDQILSDPYFV